MVKRSTSIALLTASIGWAALIFWLSTGPGLQLPASIWDMIAMDKVGHGFCYAVLLTLILFFCKSIQQLSPKVRYGVLISTIAYGIGLEFVQLYFYPHRFFEYYDIMANCIGILIGFYIFGKYFVITKTT